MTPAPGRLRSASRLALVATVAWSLFRELHLVAEDGADYRFEYYAEERDRIQVHTHSALFEADLTPRVALKGTVVYDGISGATPDGGPPPAGSSQVHLVSIHDARYAGSFETAIRLGAHTIAPKFSYSVEDDYE